MGLVENIEAACAAIDPVFRDTPQYRSEGLSAWLGASVICKVESVNPIGSFKGRGVSWWLHRQPDLDRVVCASAGNFGLAVAYLCCPRGIAVDVFVAETANPAKVEALARLGARLHTHGADLDAAKDAAREYAANEGCTFLEDGHDPAIAEGAGTMAAELGAWPDPIDVLYVPVGNGALANGIGLWFQHHRPETRVIGVSAEGAPAMHQSWHQGVCVRTDRAATIADGIAVRTPVPAALPLLAQALDDFILVSDGQIREAMQAIVAEERLIVEPSGAVSLAAARLHADATRNQTVAILLCGSNVDPRGETVSMSPAEKRTSPASSSW